MINILMGIVKAFEQKLGNNIVFFLLRFDYNLVIK